MGWWGWEQSALGLAMPGAEIWVAANPLPPAQGPLHTIPTPNVGRDSVAQFPPGEPKSGRWVTPSGTGQEAPLALLSPCLTLWVGVRVPLEGRGCQEPLHRRVLGIGL